MIFISVLIISDGGIQKIYHTIIKLVATHDEYKHNQYYDALFKACI